MDNLTSNPIAIIEQSHNLIREKLRAYAASRVIQYKWLKQLSSREAVQHYWENVPLQDRERWQKTYDQLSEELRDTFHDLFDEWILDSLLLFNLQEECKQAFLLEWQFVGPIPVWLRRDWESHTKPKVNNK